jgi:hypothetical protein
MASIHPSQPSNSNRNETDRPCLGMRMRWIAPLLLLGAASFAASFCSPKPPVPIDFAKAERGVFSQGYEDGVIESIFTRIEPTSHYAIEFGAGDGVRGSNSRNLIRNHGWSGLLIEGDPQLAAQAQKKYKGKRRVKVVQAWVFPGNVELLFEENGVPRDLDFLSIDIDSNDWYVWRAITEYRPKVVLIEYNPGFLPPKKAVVDFHPMMYWDGMTDYYGASLQSLYDLGKKKGYELVYCDSSDSNAFFVDQRYYGRFGIADNSPVRLYRPPTHGIGGGRGPNGLGWPNYDDPQCQTIDKRTKKRIKCPKTLQVDAMVIEKKWVER